MRSEGPEPVPSELPPSEQEKRSRAGRNLPAAIGVGVGLVVVILLSLFVVKDLFLLVVVVALAVGLWELGRALGTAGIAVPRWPVLLGGTVMLLAAFYSGVETAAIALALGVVGVLVWRLLDGADGYVRDVTAGVFMLGYLYLMGVFVALLLAEDDGTWRIVAFILTTVASDVGGYAAGVLFGRHPMAPTVSPKKSWEGFSGSLSAGVVAGVVVVTSVLGGPWWAGAVLGVAGAVMATLGDLSESLIKRDLGIKDMGDLLPGHGGLMDRLDSLVAVAPVSWLVLHYLVGVS